MGQVQRQVRGKGDGGGGGWVRDKGWVIGSGRRQRWGGLGRSGCGRWRGGVEDGGDGRGGCGERR